jgi:hypothetical protein
MNLEDLKDGDVIFGSDAARHGWNPSYWMRPAGFFLRARRHGLAMPKLARAFFVADEHAISWPPPMPTRPPHRTPCRSSPPTATHPPLRCPQFLGHRP